MEPRHELARLLEDVRAELRDWTDSNSHDLGVTLLELMAYVADSLAERADAVADEAYLAGGRRGPRVRVEVDGARWERVSNLDGSGPDDAHYVVNQRGGSTIIEFGDGERGRRPPAGADIRVSHRRRSRYLAVAVQQGRVVIDSDWNPPTDPQVCGIHRAVVVDATDPIGKGRLLVQVPPVTGTQSLWATPCFAPASATELPAPGDGVWVLFEEGNVQQPVWLGLIDAS